MSDWARDLREGLRSAADLGDALAPEDRAAAAAFQVRAPASYLALADRTNPTDPILAQVLPDGRELRVHPAERPDPIGDAAHQPVPRLVHRYRDRALFFPTFECAVYCRHCFRKEAINAELATSSWEPALAYVAAHPELREIILSGGDPLLLPDARLAELVARLGAIPHLRGLRVHTRIPVVLPSRVTEGLVTALEGRLPVVVVLHVNHPREVSADAEAACRRLRRAGFPLLNQAVLLRGVNDDVDTLEALGEALVWRLGATPYYLHHCDLTRGLAHLRTTIAEGQALVAALRARVPGHMVPRYILDLPGGEGKVPLEHIPRREGELLGPSGWVRYEEAVEPAR